MNLRFFGGANEVGASSTLTEIDDYRILVDAGIRMGHGQDSQLPDFPDFDKEGMPDAVLVTHAHTDHTGALPVLRNLWLAGVKLYWTPSTKAISHVLLKDSAERMQREEQEEGKPPLYTCEDLEVLLHCMEVEVPWLKPVEICPGVTATWIPAGHILGAAMIYIQGKHESILMTGDVSATNQLTIPGMVVPEWIRPEAMVPEATYGNRQHEVTRKREAKRLAKDVEKVVAAGGKVLIPAFAVGRSQEGILILEHAMARGEIREFPVYVDGMVRKVNKIYSAPDFGNGLLPSLRRKSERREDLFYTDFIKEVESRDESNSILSGESCCIVASSGMLIGGKSSFYAQRLASDPKNLIAITGYQAEGTPGRSLWDWMEAGRPSDWMWQLNDQESVDVKCQVEKYSLSAHADSEQLLALVEKVQPRKLFLVHGDAEARGELFKSVRKRFPDIDVKLPENGKSYSVGKQDGLCKGRRLRCDRILSEVFAFVRKMEWKGPFRVRELTEIWFGTEATTQMAVMFFQWCLSLDVRFFEHKVADLYNLRQPA